MGAVRAKAALRGAIALVLIVGITYAANVWMGAGACHNEVQVRAPSPDAAQDAVVFARQCGSRTGFSTPSSLTTEVAIIPRAAALPDGAGNLFRAEGGAAGPVPRGPTVVVTWHGNDRVDLRYEAGAHVTLAREALGSVKAVYTVQPK